MAARERPSFWGAICHCLTIRHPGYVPLLVARPSIDAAACEADRRYTHPHVAPAGAARSLVGNANAPPASLIASLMISMAAADKGTMCLWPFLVRGLGMVHVAASMSISLASMPVTSPTRCAVRRQSFTMLWQAFDLASTLGKRAHRFAIS